MKNSEPLPKGHIHSFESFAAVDGPGIRFLVFLRGCGFRCKYCHNPDTWAIKDGGFFMTADEVLEKALRYKNYWGSEGGITVSGGEPLLQIHFLSDLFRKAKELGVSTCLDTAATPFTREGEWFDAFNEVMANTDLVMLDIKHIRPDAHKELTLCSNDCVLDCAKYLSSIGKKMWIRHVLVPGINTDESDLRQLADFIHTLKTVEKVEVLPYHTLGVSKWQSLGIPYQLDCVPTPTPEQIELANKILCV